MALLARIALTLTFLSCTHFAGAAPLTYHLDKKASEVRFTYEFSGAETTGTMPIVQAELRLDPENIQASSATVFVDASKTRTALGFARKPLKSASVLNTKDFPIISFSSTGVSGSLTAGGKLSGDITLRGITRPIVMDVQIFRPETSPPGDISRLTLILTGSLDRSPFGAIGFPGLVGETIKFRVRAQVTNLK